MSGHTISTHVGTKIALIVKLLAKREDISTSKFIERSLKVQTLLSDSCRSLQMRILSTSSADEQAYLADQLARATVKAQEDIIDARYFEVLPEPLANRPLDTEEAIESAATRICSL